MGISHSSRNITLDRIMAIEQYNRLVKYEYPIIGWVEGALAEAADLRDISQLMMDLILEPEAVVELFEIIYLQQLEFAKAQIKSGADIIGIGDAAASLIGPDLYEEFVLPYEQRIIRDIHAMGAKAKLHICGNIEPLLPMLPQTEADIVAVDWMVNMDQAVKAFKGSKTCACGNLDPVAIFLHCDSDTMRKAVAECVAVSDEKTLIAGGCEIPRETSAENMKLMDSMLYQSL